MRAFWKVTRYARAARFWLLLALAALAWLGFGGDARAQACAGGVCTYDTRPAAYAGCNSSASTAEDWARANGMPWAIGACAIEGNPTTSTTYNCSVSGISCSNAPGAYERHQWTLEECPAGQVWNEVPGQNRCMTACSSRGTPTFTSASMIPNGSVGCDDGCEFMSQSNGDGTFSRFFIGDSASSHCSVVPNQCTNNGAGYTMNYGLSMCVPPPGPDCAPNEVKDPNTGACSQACPAGSALDAHGLCKPDVTQCPAGQIRSPEGNCLPGDGQCAAGEARKPDGTCGRDSDGDGTADDFDPETDSASFSGGDNCDSPPTCNGDVIMCGIARINWRIECNTRKDAKVSGGSCDAVPVCAGRNCDALEYAQLLSQWRTSCAVSALASDGAGTGGSDGVVDYLQGAYATEKGLLEAIGSGADGTEGVNEGDLWANFGEGDFNPNMFGTASGGSCNFNTTLELLGRPIDLPPAFWTLMQAIGWLVAASGYLWVAIRLAS